jgi:hypothetical protein
MDSEIPHLSALRVGVHIPSLDEEFVNFLCPALTFLVRMPELVREMAHIRPCCCVRDAVDFGELPAVSLKCPLHFFPILSMHENGEN